LADELELAVRAQRGTKRDPGDQRNRRGPEEHVINLGQRHLRKQNPDDDARGTDKSQRGRKNDVAASPVAAGDQGRELTS
jgi:hypothetical protein